MKVDMSSKAVTMRLMKVSQLRRLCLSLGKAKPVHAREENSGRRPVADDKKP